MEMYDEKFKKELHEAMKSIPVEYRQEIQHEKLRKARIWCIMLFSLLLTAQIYPDELLKSELWYAYLVNTIAAALLIGLSFKKIVYI